MIDPLSDPRHSDSHTAGPDEKTTVLPETAVALVEMERLQGELAAAEERAKNHWEQYLRALAEIDNVRKRAARDLESARQFAIEKFAQDLIAVKDSLELAVANAEKANADKADVASLIEGEKATLAPAGQGLRKGPDRRGQSAGSTVQSGISRGHDGAAQRCACQHRARGGAARLPVERQIAAAGTRDRVGSKIETKRILLETTGPTSKEGPTGQYPKRVSGVLYG